MEEREDYSDRNSDPYGYRREDEQCLYSGPLPDDSEEEAAPSSSAARREACNCDGCLFGGPCQLRRTA